MTLRRTFPSADFNDPRFPIASSDRLITGGTIARLDFANSDCYAGVTIDGPDKVTDLALSPAPQTYVPTGPFGVAGTGGIKRISGSSASRIVFSGSKFDLSSRQENTIACSVVINIPSSWFPGGSRAQIFSVMPSGGISDSDPQFHLGMGITDTSYFVIIAGVLFSVPVTLVKDTVIHLGATIRRDGLRTVVALFVDGELLSEGSIAYVNYAALASPAMVLFSIWYSQGWIYGVMIEDCTLSGRNPEKWVEQEYARYNASYAI